MYLTCNVNHKNILTLFQLECFLKIVDVLHKLLNSYDIAFECHKIQKFGKWVIHHSRINIQEFLWQKTEF